MTVLILDRLWINRMETGEAISARTARERPQTHTTPVEIRTYANGRQRAIASAGHRGELGFRLVDLTLPTVTRLRAWQGLTVQVRDHRGQRWHGVYASVEVGEYMTPTLYSAAITLQLVTVTEGV